MLTTSLTPRRRHSALALAAILTLAACGSDSDGAPAATDAATDSNDSTEAFDTGDTDTAATSVLAGVEAAQWSDNVTIEIGDDSFRYASNGIPSHELPDQFLVPTEGSFSPPVGEDEVEATDTSVAVVESPVDIDIPLNPVFSDTTTDTNLGTIGVVLSGAQLFNDYEDQDRSFVAVDDNFDVGGVSFVDSCNGHPLALGADGVGQGNYHYHGVPYCITDAVDVDGEHSTILGFLIDGFPFYGPKGDAGATISSDDLDECSGHVGATPEFPNGIYHYHLTEDRSPYTVDCYHGVVETSGANTSGPPADGDATADAGEGPGGDGAPDFSEAAATLGVSVDELEVALGQPPFDLDAAATALGLDTADLEAALPAPPGDGGGPPADGAPADDGAGQAAADDEATAGEVAPVDADELAVRSDVVTSAQWSDNVTITIDDDTVVFESDGLPSHEYLDTYLGDGQDGKFIAGGVEAYDARFEFPVVPTVADSPAETGNGAIGVAISGAVYFDPYEGNGTNTVANDDNETIDGIPFIDACGGHPLPSAVSYHYHGIPFCITDAVDTDGEHSVLIGYLFDGFPIYGPQDVDGNEPTDLDGCLGHTGPTPEFDDDTYHYHVTSTTNYISECLTGIA